jgi:hypothetical protein
MRRKCGQTLRTWMPIGIRTRMSIFRVSYCVNRWHCHYRCHCRERRLRYVAVFWRLSGKPQLTCNNCTWRVGRQGARANREIRRRFIYLPSGRVAPASIAKSEFRQIVLYVRKWLCAGPSVKPQTGGSSYGVGEPRFKAFGERPRQSPTAGWSILYRLRSADGRTLTLIEPSSQADRAFNPTYRPEPIWVSVTSHRNTSGERRPHGITRNAEG